MMESEERWKIGTEAAVLIAKGSTFHRFGARREKSLGRCVVIIFGLNMMPNRWHTYQCTVYVHTQCIPMYMSIRDAYGQTLQTSTRWCMRCLVSLQMRWQNPALGLKCKTLFPFQTISSECQGIFILESWECPPRLGICGTHYTSINLKWSLCLTFTFVWGNSTSWIWVQAKCSVLQPAMGYWYSNRKKERIELADYLVNISPFWQHQ